MTTQSFRDRHFQISLGIGYGVASEWAREAVLVWRRPDPVAPV